jgi:hypothetical protein
MNDIRPFVIPGCAILAQARNPYSLQALWIPGSRCARPGMTVVDDVGIIPCHDEKEKVICLSSPFFKNIFVPF